MMKTDDYNDQSVTKDKIRDGNITAEKLTEGAVSTGKLSDGAVSTSKIASRSVTNEKIAYNSVSRAELTPEVRSSIDKKADAEQVNNSLYDLEKKLGDRFVVEGDVTNLPDEEDLTSVKESERDVLKLADRSYAPRGFSGKGYKILRKNIKPVSLAVTKIVVSSVPTSDGYISFIINGVESHVDVVASSDTTTDKVADKIAAKLSVTMTEYEVLKDASTITLTRKFGGEISTSSSFSAVNTGASCSITDSTKREFRNILTQAIINQPNTIYEIRYDYDIQGENIKAPEGSTLFFNGGGFKNGHVEICPDLKIMGTPSFKNISISNIEFTRNIEGSHINVDNFGADPKGLHDSTDAIRLAVVMANIMGVEVNFTANGKYLLTDAIYCFTGTTINGNNSQILVNDKRAELNPFKSDSIFRNFDQEPSGTAYNSNGDRYVYGTANIKIKGFNVDLSNINNLESLDNGYSSPRGVIGLYDCYNVEISNMNIITNIEPNPIWLIDCSGKVVLRGNKFKRNSLYNTASGIAPNEGGWMWFYLLRKSCDSVVIEDNYLECRWDENIHLACHKYKGVYGDYSKSNYGFKNVVIRNNYMSNPDVMCIALGTENSSIPTIFNVEITDNIIFGTIDIKGGNYNNIIIKNNKISNELCTKDKKETNGYYCKSNIIFDLNSNNTVLCENLNIENNSFYLKELSDEDSIAKYSYINYGTSNNCKINNLFVANNIFKSDNQLDIAIRLFVSIYKCTINNNKFSACDSVVNIYPTEQLLIESNILKEVNNLFLSFNTNKVIGFIKNNIIKSSTFKIVKNDVYKYDTTNRVIFVGNTLSIRPQDCINLNPGKSILILENCYDKETYTNYIISTYFPFGDNENKPVNKIGAWYFNTSNNTLQYQANLEKWLNINAYEVNVKTLGATSDRPRTPRDYMFEGFSYYDTDLKSIIFHFNNEWYYPDGTFAYNAKVGETSDRPFSTNIGTEYYDTTLNKPIWWNGTAWLDKDGNPADALNQGDTGNRPKGIKVGFIYKDTTLNKLIVWDGTSWVNMDGTALT